MDISPNVVPFVTPSDTKRTKTVLDSNSKFIHRWRKAIQNVDGDTLPPLAKLIAHTLWDYFTEADPSARPKVETTLVLQTGMARSSVHKHLDILVDKGFLVRLSRGKNRPANYIAVIPPLCRLNQTSKVLVPRPKVADTPEEIKQILNDWFKIPSAEQSVERPSVRHTDTECPPHGHEVPIISTYKNPLCVKSKIIPTVEEIDAYQKTIKEGINFNPQVFYQKQKDKDWPGDWKSQVPIWRIREAEYQAKHKKTRKPKKRVDRKKETSVKIDGYNDIPDTSWADDDQDNVVAIQEKE